MRVRQVRDLNWLSGLTGLADGRLAEIDRRAMNRGKKLAAEIVAGNDVEGLTRLIELKDSTAIGLLEIHRMAGNRIKHLPQIQRRTDRPADVA